MELYSDDVPRIAEQRFFQLRETDLWIATAKPFLNHHLFGIVSPTFDVRTAIDDLPGLRRKLLRVQELDVMPRIGFMDRDDIHYRRIERAQMLVLVLSVPIPLRRGDVIKRLCCL